MDKGGTQNALKIVMAACNIKKKYLSTLYDIAFQPTYLNMV